jgi:hypothetical protein
VADDEAYQSSWGIAYRVTDHNLSLPHDNPIVNPHSNANYESSQLSISKEEQTSLSLHSLKAVLLCNMSSKVFRVRGLPLGTETEIISYLDRVLRLHASEPELQRRGKVTVAPSCDDDKTSVALLEWKGDAPDFLSSLGNKRAKGIELDDRDISFDDHFYGLTQLYSTREGEPINAESVLIAMKTSKHANFYLLVSSP